MKKLSLLLVLAMLCGLLPVFVLAEPADITVYTQDFERLSSSVDVRMTNEVDDYDNTSTLYESGDSLIYGITTLSQANYLFAQSFHNVTEQGELARRLSGTNATDVTYVEDADVGHKVMKISKASGSTKQLKLDVSTLPGLTGAHTVEFDLKIIQSANGNKVQIDYGTTFSLKNAGDKDNTAYTVCYYPDGSSETDMNGSSDPRFNFTTYRNIKVVRNADANETTDLYIDDVKVVDDAPLRSSVTKTLLVIQAAKSLICNEDGQGVWIDDLKLYPGTPEAPYTYPDYGDHADNTVLKIEKSTEALADGTTVAADSWDFSTLLAGATDYTVSFDMGANLFAGSYDLTLGGSWRLGGTGTNGYTISALDSEGTYTQATTLTAAQLHSMVPVKIAVKGGTTYDLYVGDSETPVIADGAKLADASLTQLVLQASADMAGSVYFDNLSLTLNDYTAASSATVTADTAAVDFEDFTAGVLTDGTAGFVTGYGAKTGLVAVENTGDVTHGNALALISPLKKCTYTLKRNYSSLISNAKKYEVQLDVNASGTNGYNIQETSTGVGGYKLSFDLSSNGIRYQPNGGSWTKITTFPSTLTSAKPSADTWYTLKLAIDTEANTADFYVDGTKVAEGLTPYDDELRGGIYIGTNNSTQGKLLIDNFSVTVTEEKPLPEEAYITGEYNNRTCNASGFALAGTESPVLFAAFYEDTKLIHIDLYPQSAGALFTQSVTLPLSGTPDSVKLMLWDKYNRPLCVYAEVSLSTE